MPIRLGFVQFQIMRVLWDQGESTAREITETMCKKKAIAHSTVQTLLRQLVAKNVVGYEVRDRTFHFKALVTESEASGSAVGELLDRVFQGSISGLVSHLLDIRMVSDSELNELRELIDKQEKK